MFFLREHDFNNDSHLDGLEILAAIKVNYYDIMIF